MRRSLEEISKDLKEIENVITATEIAVRNAHKADQATSKRRRSNKTMPNKENKTPSPTGRQSALSGASQKTSPVTYKLNSFKRQRQKMRSPRLTNSKLYFRNGRIGCLEADQHGSNIQGTHALVKHILRYVNEKPLVSPESVRRVLNGTKTPTSSPVSLTTTTTPPPVPLPPMKASLAASNCAMASASAKQSGESVLLPGEVPEECPADVVVKSYSICSNNTANDSHSQRRPQSEGSSMTENTMSQPLVDDDEQDVQICYDELPDILNDEQNFGPELVKSDFAAVAPEEEVPTDRRFSATRYVCRANRV